MNFSVMSQILRLAASNLWHSLQLVSRISEFSFSSVCPYCHRLRLNGEYFHGHNTSFRSQSTSTWTKLNKSSKKKNKTRKGIADKYAEILQVTDSSHAEVRARVSKLKPRDVAQMVEHDNLTLSEFHDVRTRPAGATSKKSKDIELPSIAKASKSSEVSAVGQELVSKVSSDASEALSENVEDIIKYESVIGGEECCDIPALAESEMLNLSVEDGITPDLDLENSLSVINTKLQIASQYPGFIEHHVDDVFEDAEAEPTEELHAEVNECFEEESSGDVLDQEALASLASVLPAKEENLDKRIRKVLSQSTKTKAAKKANVQANYRKAIKEKLAKRKQAELEKASREYSLSHHLRSYVDLCVNAGYINRAMSTVLYYRSKGKRDINAPAVKDIKIYNVLLAGFARKGQLNKITEVFQVLHDDNIKADIQSYAACLECLGRHKESPANSKFISRTIEEMKENKMEPNDVFLHAKFVSDQRERIVDAIRRVQHSFEPCVTPWDPSYSCVLLKELNEHRLERQQLASSTGGVISNEELKAFANEQFEIERSGVLKVNSIEQKPSNDDSTVAYYRQIFAEMEENWREIIANAFQRDLEIMHSQNLYNKFGRHLSLYPYLRMLEIQQYVEIVMQEIRKLAEGSETYSPTTNQLYRQLGHHVLCRYQVKSKENSGILNKVKLLYEEFGKWYVSPDDFAPSNARQKWQDLMFRHQEGPSIDIEEKQWPYTTLIGIGKFLYNIIMRDIKIDVNVFKTNSTKERLLPAFYTVFRHQGRLLREEVKPHPALSRLLRAAAPDFLTFPAVSLPMLCPPIPWTSVHQGGYLVSGTEFIRLPRQAHQQQQQLEVTPVQQMYPSLDSLNQLGMVPWKINAEVLDIITDVFRSGGSAELDVPQPPSAHPLPPPLPPDASRADKFRNIRQKLMARRKRAEMYSLWCDALYRLSLANHFRKRMFWFPHNMDFRGRVYPCPPHLNHLGADLARSILVFAKGEPLGEKGLDWLKIHLVNLTGLKKKEPIESRLAFANEIMPEVLDSADHPLTGRQWWTKSDEPWQTLATCIEICKAVRSGDSENYVCHFPVHQDGSCNGLQHYAALGRDQAGAESVNLTPAAVPQDVYSCVAALVERERAKDAETGVVVAKVLDGFIGRKVIKQTVMTTVYGVTRFGARLQIARQLKDIDEFPKEYVWPASTYLVGRTFLSLQEMFTSTKEIQDWFTECARLISQVCGQNVEWTTPLGLPIVQPYHRQKKVEPLPGGSRITERCTFDTYERPNVMKQKNAFPPNFIHSLDSSHMILTSLYCENAGITFVSVHDCFWTHPNTVEVMNKVCREQFVALHLQPILEDLSQYMVKKYSYQEKELLNDGSVVDLTKKKLNRILTQVPKKGDFNLLSVLDSTYFFS